MAKQGRSKDGVDGRAFEEWREGPEFALLDKIKRKMAEAGLALPIETTPDITSNWQPTFDLVASLGAVLRVKGVALKALPQETLRTAFFGGVNKRDEPFTVDTFNLDFINKEYPKNCRHVKNTFIELLKCIDEVDTVEDANFADWRKNKLIYKYKEFVKFYKEHVRKDKGHAETKKLLGVVLEPLRLLLEAASRLVGFRLSCDAARDVDTRYFQYKADVLEFCARLQPCVDTLHQFAPEKVPVAPDVAQIFKKLTLPGWEGRPVEAYFLEPMRQAVERLLAGLIKLHSMGGDFWRQPLAANGVLLDDVSELVNRDALAEEMLGTPLRRLQAHFFYDLLTELAADRLLRPLILDQDAAFCASLFPIVVAVRSLDRFQQLVKRLCAECEANLRNPSPTECLVLPEDKGELRFELLSFKVSRHTSATSAPPPPYTFSQACRRADGFAFTFTHDDDSSTERLMLWPDHLSPPQRQEFEENALQLGRLNAAVVDDIEDALVAEELRQISPATAEAVHAAAQSELQNREQLLRPPFLWNEPNSMKRPHRLRLSATLEGLQDPKVLSMAQAVRRVAEQLQASNAARWGFLYTHAIKAVIASLQKDGGPRP